MIRPLLLVGFGFLWLVTASAEEAARGFLRFVEDAKGASLQTAVVHYQTKSGVVVDLVGAVHIADKKYYDELNHRFGGYDSVLYELVGGPMPKMDLKEMEKREVDPRMAWLGKMQVAMKNALKLTGQLEGVNYQAKNFVHADMSADQFYKIKEEKNETFLGLLAKAWKVQAGLEEGKEGSQPSLVKLMEILCRKDSADELKRLVGREFDSMESLIAGMEAGGGTVIVGERNRVALEVLDREIARGKRKIAIFYGAAHLPDMQKKLEARGFIRGQTEWLKAWDLPPEPKTPPVVETK
ncbi:MAG: TraB family protein [Verrucomicrobiaceae bacterium]|nr:TraB family protein [Verrucomicrobiaceae bacterium]